VDVSAAPVVVVGGGIAGLAAALRLTETLGPEGVVLLERDRRLGGKILTERGGGYVIEGGPDCFLAAKPAGVELCRHLGIAERLQPTNPACRQSYVKRGGRLHQLPEGLTGLVPSRLGPLLGTRLLSVPGRLRAGLELFVPRRRGPGDESLAAFVIRRFGTEAYEWLVEPLLSGIYAGDGRELSLAATFPQLAELERTRGSLLRAMLGAGLNGGSGRGAGPPDDGGVRVAPNGGMRAAPNVGTAAELRGFVTPAGGLGEIVEAVARRLAPQGVRLGAAVAGVRRGGAGWEVLLAGGGVMPAGAVILATPAFEAAAQVAALDSALSAELAGIPFVSVATVSVAFRAGAVPHRLPGYGYVTPRAEGGDVVACTVTSNKFPSRVPGSAVLLRFFLGRAGREAVAAAEDEELRGLVREEMARVFRLTAEPAEWRVVRWARGMPQYALGHPERLARISRRLEGLPGLMLAGASYRGVGLPDCIASGWAAAERALGVVRSAAA
jgi:oxygen-dependent protoporphyrinogen oxidase